MKDTIRYAETIGLAGIIVDKRKNEQFNYDSHRIKNSVRYLCKCILRDQHAREKFLV